MLSDSASFLDAARQHGYGSGAARAALETVRMWLAENAVSATEFYIFRTGSSGSGSSGSNDNETRPRLLTAFRSADAALAFAQQRNLGASPRLLRIHHIQLLSILVQRPTISALLFVDDSADLQQSRGLPAGVRLERTTLIELLTRNQTDE